MQAGYPGIDSETTQAGVTACEAPVLVSVTAFIWFPELPGTFRGVFLAHPTSLQLLCRQCEMPLETHRQSPVQT